MRKVVSPEEGVGRTRGGTELTIRIASAGV
jgi:hypothetical protein